MDMILFIKKRMGKRKRGRSDDRNKKRNSMGKNKRKKYRSREMKAIDIKIKGKVKDCNIIYIHRKPGKKIPMCVAKCS